MDDILKAILVAEIRELIPAPFRDMITTTEIEAGLNAIYKVMQEHGYEIVKR